MWERRKIRSTRWLPITGVIVAALVGLGGVAAAAEPGAAGVPSPDSGPISGGTEVRVPAPAGVTFTEVRAGTIHTLGLGSDGRAYAWGYNSQGQLGTGNTDPVDVPVPVAVPDGVAFTALAAGGEFSVGLTDDGDVYTWGYNSAGMIGNGTTTNVNVPTLVNLPVPVVSIAAGEYSVLALGEDSAVYGWGRNSSGGLGTGSVGSPELSPVEAAMPPGVTFTRLSASNSHTLALTADGQAYGWGRNSDGELGTGAVSSTPVSAPAPVTMPTGVGFTSVSAGGGFSVGIGDDGAVYTWGSNAAGQLGNGTSGSVPTLLPTKAHTPDGVTFLSATAAQADSEDRAGRGINAGGYHTLALGSDGKAYAWGRNVEGQLGNGTQVNSADPVEVRLPEGVEIIEVGSGVFNSVALSAAGAAYTWGYNPLGQAGNPAAPSPFVLEPFPVAMDPVVTSITFDGADGSELTPQESGEWSAVTPAHAAGPVDVVVSWTQFGIEREPVTYPGGFTYVGPGLAVSGEKRVEDVRHGTPGLPGAAPSSWEITATQGEDVRVISGGDPVQLPAGQSSVLGERIAADAPQAALAARYAPLGEVSCLDAEGAALPKSVFDPATGTLTVPDTAEDIAAIPAPVTCELVNQAAHASFVTRSGTAATAAPAAGWGLALDHSADAADTALAADAASAVVLPGEYGLTATIPAGLVATGIDRLATDTAACADAALDPIAAPEACWTRLSAAQATAAQATTPQGEHTVFRVTATADDGGGTTEPGEPTTPPTTPPPTNGGSGPLATTGGASTLPLLLAAAVAALGGLALWRRGRARA